MLSYQDGVGLVAVLAREGGVDGETDAVPHDSEQDEEIKGFPLHQRYAVLPVNIEIRRELSRCLATQQTLKGFSETGSPWTAVPCPGEAWPPPAWPASCPPSGLRLRFQEPALLSILQIQGLQVSVIVYIVLLVNIILYYKLHRIFQPHLKSPDLSRLHGGPSSYLQHKPIDHKSRGE